MIRPKNKYIPKTMETVELINTVKDVKLLKLRLGKVELLQNIKPSKLVIKKDVAK